MHISRSSYCGGRVASAAAAARRGGPTTWTWTTPCKRYGGCGQRRVPLADGGHSVRTRERVGACLLSGWISLLPGLFAQAGIAEEVLFRGYLFGHIRVGRTFWRAAAVSMLPFVTVHLVLFFSMPWSIALASVLLAIVISFPLAHLFELGGDTIWAPAFLHFVIQATVKVLVFSQGAESFAIVWMAASATVPLVIFAVKTPTGR